MSSVVHTANSSSLVYQPPLSARNARSILVKPNLGYPGSHPVTVSIPVLGKILAALRQASPHAEILIVEGVCSAVSLPEIAKQHGLAEIMDEGMRLLDADTLPLIEYLNISPAPIRFKSMWAPALLQEVDCRITVGTLKRTILKEEPLISAALKNLYGLFPRSHYKARSANSRGQLHRPGVPQVLQDVYFTIGHLFDGAVIDAHQRLLSKDWHPDKGQKVDFGKVFFGDDVVAVDLTACKAAGEDIPSYLEAIDLLRLQLSNMGLYLAP